MDWIKVPLAIDINSGKVSKLAIERFGIENSIEVYNKIAWITKAAQLARISNF